MPTFFQRLRPSLLFTGLLLGSAAVARAQVAPATIRLLPEDAQRKQNGNQHNFYFLPPGVTGENYQNAGFFGQKLRPYLAGNEEALTNLNYYRRQKTLFLIDRVMAVGALGVYGQQVFEKDKFPQYFSDVQKVAAGVFVTSLLATIFINNNTNQHFQRAVASYNASKSQGTLWHRLQPAGVGVGSTMLGQPTLALRWKLR
jgi:hypothetical protein